MSTFRVLVIGSRDFDDYSILKHKLDNLLLRLRDTHQIELVSDGEEKIASLVEKYADEMGFLFYKEVAQWNKHGRNAGILRDDKIHRYISMTTERCVIDFWNGESKEPCYTMPLSKKYSNPVIVYDYRVGKVMKLNEATKIMVEKSRNHHE